MNISVALEPVSVTTVIFKPVTVLPPVWLDLTVACCGFSNEPQGGTNFKNWVSPSGCSVVEL